MPINLQNIFIFLTLLYTPNFILAGNYQKKDSLKREKVLSLVPGENNPRNSEGSFVTLHDGRILFIYSHYTGSSSNDHAPAFLASRYSADNGKTWSKEDIMVVPQEGKMNVMSVSLLRMKNGAIALFYLIKNSEQDCIPWMRISNDEARTWSEPRPCILDRQGYFVLNNDRVIQLSNGRLLMPVALHATPGSPQMKQEADLFTYYSDDNGNSWKRSEQVPNKDNIITQEPGLVSLTDGRLAMFIRTNSGYQYISYSSDAGETWSPIEPFTLMSPLAPASIKQIPGTQNLLAVWNNNHAVNELYKGKRTPLTIAISEDNGKSWKHIHNLETADAWFCYTAILFVKKYVLLAYCSGSLAKTDIVRIKLRNLY